MSKKNICDVLLTCLILLMPLITATSGQEYLFTFVYKNPSDYQYIFDIDGRYLDMDVPILSSPDPTSQGFYGVKVEPDNAIVREKALQIAAEHPGSYSIDQVCAIADYVGRWRYVSDPKGFEYVNYANESIRVGKIRGYSGIGDCDDRAVLLASLIESIGGTTRIISACNNETCHAYPEVYIGTSYGDLSNVDNTPIGGIMWRLIQIYNKYSYYSPMNIHCRETRYIDGDGQICRDLWLPLDYGRPGNGHYNGQYCSVLWSSTHLPSVPTSLSASTAIYDITWRQAKWTEVGSGNKGRPDYQQDQVRKLITSDAEWAARGSGKKGRPG